MQPRREEGSQRPSLRSPSGLTYAAQALLRERGSAERAIGYGAVVSVQTGDPLPHSITDTRQAPCGVQVAPGLQTHAPVTSQTRPVPHDVPVGS